MNKMILVGVVIVLVLTVTVGYLSIVIMQPKTVPIRTEEMARAEIKSNCMNYCAKQSLTYVNETFGPMLIIHCYCSNVTDVMEFKLPA